MRDDLTAALSTTAAFIRTTERTTVLAQLTDLIFARRRPKSVLRVGIDGVDGAGKSALGDELAGTLRARGLSVVRASVDGFHHPASTRYQRGRGSSLGFYEDSYDYESIWRELLEPFGPNGSRRYRTAVYDVQRERPVMQQSRLATGDAVLVVDGIFLHRPELRDAWDWSMFVRVPFATSVPRGARRGYGHPDPAHHSNRRYVEGQRHYLATCDPEGKADVVIDNTDLARPIVVRTW